MDCDMYRDIRHNLCNEATTVQLDFRKQCTENRDANCCNKRFVNIYKSTKNNNTRKQCNVIVNMYLALMKQRISSQKRIVRNY